MTSKQRNILAVITLTILVFAAYVYYQYNRTSSISQNTTADFNINAVNLIHEFEKDQTVATKKYVGKVTEIDGTYLNLEEDEAGNYTLIIGADSLTSKIRCSMDSTVNVNDLKALSKNQQLLIKGICTGYNPDDLGLGADILLNKCMILKK